MLLDFTRNANSPNPVSHQFHETHTNSGLSTQSILIVLRAICFNAYSGSRMSSRTRSGRQKRTRLAASHDPDTGAADEDATLDYEVDVGPELGSPRRSTRARVLTRDLSDGAGMHSPLADIDPGAETLPDGHTPLLTDQDQDTDFNTDADSTAHEDRHRHRQLIQAKRRRGRPARALPSAADSPFLTSPSSPSAPQSPQLHAHEGSSFTVRGRPLLKLNLSSFVLHVNRSSFLHPDP